MRQQLNKIKGNIIKHGNSSREKNHHRNEGTREDIYLKDTTKWNRTKEEV